MGLPFIIFANCQLDHSLSLFLNHISPAAAAAVVDDNDNDNDGNNDDDNDDDGRRKDNGIIINSSNGIGDCSILWRWGVVMAMAIAEQWYVFDVCAVVDDDDDGRRKFSQSVKKVLPFVAKIFVTE